MRAAQIPAFLMPGFRLYGRTPTYDESVARLLCVLLRGLTVDEEHASEQAQSDRQLVASRLQARCGGPSKNEVGLRPAQRTLRKGQLL